MKKLLIAATLMLAGCAGHGGLGEIVTPQRCEDALRTASSAQQLADLLVSLGIVPADKAADVARFLRDGKVSIALLCAAANG